MTMAMELDFSKPLETEKGEPVKWICADVIEYKSARVCVAQDTGLVYSSPYIGLKIRNVVSAPELERPVVVAWSNWKVGTRSHVPFRTEEEAARSVNASEIAATQEGPYSVEQLMTVAQHDRIVGALRVTHQCTMGVGSGDGQLFVHGDHASIKAAQKIVLERDAAQARVAELEKQVPVYTKPSWADNYGWSGGHIDFKCAWEVEKLARHFEELLDAVPEGPLYAAPVAQAPAAMPPFAEKVLAKLRRFQECAEDFESGGVDIGRHWLDLLTQLGLLNRVQRSPALWEISQQGEDLLEAPVAQAGQVPEGYMLITQDQVERHATTAWECPPQSRVVLVSTLKRLNAKNVAAPQPAGGE